MLQANRIRGADLCLVFGLSHVELGVWDGQAWRTDLAKGWPISGEVLALDSSNFLLHGLKYVEEEISNWIKTEAEPLQGVMQSISAVRVLLADPLVQTTTLIWHDDLCQEASSEKYVREQFARVGTPLLDSDVIRVGEAPFGARRLAVAYPSRFVRAVQDLAKRLKVTQSSVLPYSFAAWCALSKPTSSSERTQHFGVADHDWCALLAAERYLVGHHYRYSPSVSDTGFGLIENLWVREKLRNGQAKSVSALTVWSAHPGALDKTSTELSSDILPVQTPGQENSGLSPAMLLAPLRTKDSTFNGILQPPGRHGLWFVMFILATIAVLLAYSCWKFQNKIEGVRSARAAVVVPPAVVQMPSLGKQEVARIQPVNDAIRALNFPVMTLLNALRAPTDIQVWILNVDLNSISTGKNPKKQSLIQITVEAKSAVDMAHYVSYISDRKPFVSAQLLRHEIIDVQSGPIYRFVVEAAWQD